MSRLYYGLCETLTVGTLRSAVTSNHAQIFSASYPICVEKEEPKEI